jgi:hypothetical protein
LADKIWKWFLYTVVLAVIPVAASVLLAVIFGVPEIIPYALSGGQLLIAAAGIAGSSVGEVERVRPEHASYKRWAVGGAIATLLFSSIVYGGLSIIPLLEEKLSQDYDQVINIPVGDSVTVASVILFVLGMAAGGACVYLAALEGSE